MILSVSIAFLLVRCSLFQDGLENEDLAIANNDIKTQNLHRNERDVLIRTRSKLEESQKV